MVDSRRVTAAFYISYRSGATVRKFSLQCLDIKNDY